MHFYRIDVFSYRWDIESMGINWLKSSWFENVPWFANSWGNERESGTEEFFLDLKSLASNRF